MDQKESISDDIHTAIDELDNLFDDVLDLMFTKQDAGGSRRVGGVRD